VLREKTVYNADVRLEQSLPGQERRYSLPTDSMVEHEYITTHQYFKEIGEEVGLTVRADILRIIDVGSKYLSKTIGKINQEHVLIFEKINEKWENTDSKSYTRSLLERLLKSCKPKNKGKIQEALMELS